MELDRDINVDGKGKYALINMRKIPTSPRTPQELAEAILKNPECVEFGRVGTEQEFFVIKLKDAFSQVALKAYSNEAYSHDPQYSDRILNLAERAGTDSPFCKLPD